MKDLENQLKASWDTNADAWIQSIRGKKIESRNLVTDRAILDEILSYQPRKVLDFGCGEGWLSRTLSDYGIEVIGMDGSKELVQNAKTTGKGTYYHLSYEDFCSNPMQLAKDYDVIVCNFSLLSQNIHMILKSFPTVLSTNGVVIIQTLHPYSLAQNGSYEDGWREESYQGMGEGYKAAMPWYYRTMGSWLNEIQSVGLRIVHCKEPIHPITGKPLSLLLTAKK